jgi:hypothetical protein
MTYDISDYVDVKTRIELLYKKYENASIQFEFKGVMDGNPDFIWGIAYVYRNPDDPRPATGTAHHRHRTWAASLPRRCLARVYATPGRGNQPPPTCPAASRPGPGAHGPEPVGSPVDSLTLSRMLRMTTVLLGPPGGRNAGL